MKIQLETLPHQIKAIKKIKESFSGVDYDTLDPDKNYIYANPILKNRGDENHYIDIKMETGTGKTFVYTQMMYEMHKMDIFKFIIVVPTPSIKEGTKSFINSDYARQYFSSIPGYENISIQLNEINAGDFTSKKSHRKNFPSQLSEFVEATRQNANQIQVLLINSGMLNSKSMSNNDYDQTLLGGETNPIKAISATRPVVIIDEPHRFPRDKSTYNVIKQLCPQLIVRFGATFPKKIIGKGKNKTEITDYYRKDGPAYNLNAIDSFNKGLVKGIDISYPDITEEEANNLYTVKTVTSKKLTLTKNSKEYTIEKNGYLSEIDPNFYGNISYQGSSRENGRIIYKLSNELELDNGVKLVPGTFSENYQDQIILEALDNHFLIEEKNFLRNDTGNRAPKIKTLSLFFIDSISSFRDRNGNKGWLSQHFENMLRKKLKFMINKYELSLNDREKDYCDFLIATLNSLNSDNQQVYAGYFSEDRGSSDESIREEVDDILKNKEKLLSFKDNNGNWITRRFLFSKWTLREGWDNPNVFVIAKLRSSGSENSKIQEVGRGLRLPVDEIGHRLQQSEYESRLSFLIGYDEKDFGDELLGEVNSDSPIKINRSTLSHDMQELIVKTRKKSNPEFNINSLLTDLDSHKIIDRENNFMDNVKINGNEMSGYSAFAMLYPEIENESLVSKDKVRNVKKDNISTKVKLRKNNWNQLKDIWTQLSRRMMIKFDSSVNSDSKDIAKMIFKDSENDTFVLSKIQNVTKKIEKDADNNVYLSTTKSDSKIYTSMNYGKFLKIISLSTDLNPSLLNNLMIESMKKLNNNPNYINEKTMNNIIRKFNAHFKSRVKNMYEYVPLDFSSSTSIYDSSTENFVDYVSANDLGTFYSNNVTNDSKYLYNRPPLRYDSVDPELDILKRTYSDDIVVFGKLPKRAIKIPRYDSGTTTPDFIFKLNRKNNDPIYLVIETKAENMRIGDEEIKLIQKKYFDKLSQSGVYYKMATSEEEVHEWINKFENGEL